MDDDLPAVARVWVPHKPEARLSMALHRFLYRALAQPHYVTALKDADGIQRSNNARARDKVRGVKGGQLDWDIVQGQPLLARKLELKRNSNDLSEQQRETVRVLTACGAEPIVTWTLRGAYEGLMHAGFRFTDNAPWVLKQCEEYLAGMDREAELIKSGVIQKSVKSSKPAEPRYAWNKRVVARARRGGIAI